MADYKPQIDKDIEGWSGGKAEGKNVPPASLPPAREVFGPARKMVSQEQAQQEMQIQKSQERPRQQRVNYKLPE